MEIKRLHIKKQVNHVPYHDLPVFGADKRT